MPHPSLFPSKQLKSSLLLALFFLLLLSSLTLFRPVVVISVREKGEQGIDIYGHFLLPGEGFTYIYRHSVEKTPVEENYQTTWSGKLSLASTRFQSYGAGLPLETSNFSLENGRFLLAEPGVTLPEIRIRVSRLPGQTLIFNTRFHRQEYRLQILAPPGKLIVIKTTSLIGWVLASGRFIN